MKKRTAHILISWACFLGAAVVISVLLTGCQNELHREEWLMLHNRLDYMQGRAQVPPPLVEWTTSSEFELSGWTDCTKKTITLNQRVAAYDLPFMLYKVIPHEYAHWASCYHRGNTDGGSGNPHDDYWKQWVIRLGGDPEYI